jgi:hypothetical protein
MNSGKRKEYIVESLDLNAENVITKFMMRIKENMCV